MTLNQQQLIIITICLLKHQNKKQINNKSHIKMGLMMPTCQNCKQTEQQEIIQIDKHLIDQLVQSRFAKNQQQRKKICKNLVETGIYVQEDKSTGIIYNKEKGVYSGKIRDNMANGKGTLVFRNLNEYKGEFKDGNFDGFGQIKDCSSQSKFKGTFKDGIPISGSLQYSKSESIKIIKIEKISSRSFKAQINFPNGLQYIGQVASNKYPYFVPQGQGTMKFPDKSYYQGQWFNGKMNGKGKYFWQNGDRYEGQYKNGQRWGVGRMEWTEVANKSQQFQDKKQIDNKKQQIRKKRYSYQGYWQRGIPSQSIIRVNAEQNDELGPILK